jgi:predicted MFS family arabinose efflux permease
MTLTDEADLGNKTGLLILALAVFAVVTTEMAPVGLLPAIGRAFGESESTTGLLVSLYAAVVALVAVPLTRTIDRKRLLLIAIGCFTVSNVAAAAAPTFEVLAGARALGGATHALFFSICIGYATRLVPPASIGRALALASAGASAGFVLGVPLATVLGNAFGWRGAFIALAALMAFVFIAVAIRLPDVELNPEHDGPANGRRRLLLAAVAPNALSYLGQYTLYTYISVMLLRAHASHGAVGPILLLFGLAGLIGLSIAGPRVDHHFRQTALVSLTLVLVGITANGIGFPHLAILIAVGVVWCGAFAPMASIYQAAAVRTRATSPDVAGAFVNATSNIGIGGGAALGSLVLHEAGIRANAWAAAACVALAVVVVLLAREAFPGHR